MDLSINIQMSRVPSRNVAPTAPVATDPPVRQDDTEGTAAVRPSERDADHEWSKGHRQHHTQGRRHVQRAARHLLRDIRHDMRSELKELREAGDTEKIKAVKDAYRDFRSGVKDVISSAGRGHDFDRGAIAEGLGAAMVSFTEALRELNGTADEAVPESIIEPALAADKAPAPTVDLPTGALLDVGA